MVSAIFNTFFYDPIYNVLVALMAFAPGGDVGFAVIALTVLIRLALLPLSLSAARSQRAMRALEPKLQEIKEKHGENREEYAKKTLELYRTEGVNPFSGIVSIFVQLPVLFALYWVFLEPFATLDIARVYSFTPTPDAISGSFLGLIDLASKSIVLAVLAGVTQYFQAAFSLSGMEQPKGTGMQADFTRAMNMQLRYVFPILIATIAYSTSAAIALYFVTTNATGALQEWYVKRKFAASSNTQSS